MDRGAWWATVHGVPRVRHDLETEQQPPPVPLGLFQDPWETAATFVLMRTAEVQGKGLGKVQLSKTGPGRNRKS